MSTKLLVIGEAGWNSGFEKVVRGVCTHLHERGDYDITVRGVGYNPRHPFRRYPYKVKEVDAAPDDIFGVRNFDAWVVEDQPDLVFMVHDIWNMSDFLIRKPVELPAVLYYPVDAPGVKPAYTLALSAVAEAVSYTRFGAHETAVGVRGALDELTRVLEPQLGSDARLAQLRTPRRDTELVGRWDRLLRYQNPDNFNIIPHGHEHGRWQPRDKARARSLLGIPDDAFVVLNVGTNSARKRLDLTIRAFRHVAAARSDAYLVLHCSNGSPHIGWDLTAAAQYYGIPKDRLILSHQLYPNATDDELCWIYNTADVQVNTSGGEGFSLCNVEGAACGVPQLVPDWSATREIWEKHTELIPVKNVRMEPKFLNTVHAEIDTAWLGETLLGLSSAPKCRRDLADRALRLAGEQHSWAEVGEAFHEVLQNAGSEPGPRGVTFDEIRLERRGDLVSEGVRD